MCSAVKWTFSNYEQHPPRVPCARARTRANWCSSSVHRTQLSSSRSIDQSMSWRDEHWGAKNIIAALRECPIWEADGPAANVCANACHTRAHERSIRRLADEWLAARSLDLVSSPALDLWTRRPLGFRVERQQWNLSAPASSTRIQFGVSATYSYSRVQQVDEFSGQWICLN